MVGNHDLSTPARGRDGGGVGSWIRPQQDVARRGRRFLRRTSRPKEPAVLSPAALSPARRPPGPWDRRTFEKPSVFATPTSPELQPPGLGGADFVAAVAGRRLLDFLGCRRGAGSATERDRRSSPAPWEGGSFRPRFGGHLVRPPQGRRSSKKSGSVWRSTKTSRAWRWRGISM